MEDDYILENLFIPRCSICKAEIHILNLTVTLNCECNKSTYTNTNKQSYNIISTSNIHIGELYDKIQFKQCIVRHIIREKKYKEKLNFLLLKLKMLLDKILLKYFITQIDLFTFDEEDNIFN